ncbi:MAG TPA: hypothetical protein VMT18_08560 [Planctomycetota bacterium]|nr:hypothetical protein [Planctomycetota bacterium]
MDLDGYWQENKRFVTSVAGGGVAFLVVWFVIDANLGRDLRRMESRRTNLTRDLAEPMFGNAELDRARAENTALRASVAALREHSDFQARATFAPSPDQAPSSRYVGVVSSVRETLLQDAGRAGLVVPADLGLPTLAPTREAEIERTLEALDAVERLVRLAMAARVQRIDQIRIRLDSRLLAGKPIADLERTEIEFALTGPSEPIVRLLELCAEPVDGRTLLVRRAEVKEARGRRNEVRLELELAVTHPHGLGAVEDAQGEG